MDEQEQALVELEALVKVPGALKIITNEHACGAGLHPARDPRFDHDRCAAFAVSRDGVDTPIPETDPRHFVHHDVVAVEPAPEFGPTVHRAVSAEGDWTIGEPAALLRRLREWRGA